MIKIRVTAAQKKKLAEAAKVDGMDAVGTWLRSLGLRRAGQVLS